MKQATGLFTKIITALYGMITQSGPPNHSPDIQSRDKANAPPVLIIILIASCIYCSGTFHPFSQSASQSGEDNSGEEEARTNDYNSSDQTVTSATETSDLTPTVTVITTIHTTDNTVVTTTVVITMPNDLSSPQEASQNTPIERRTNGNDK